MKKLVKILGLLLVAGALFVGCKQEANIETDKIEFSNGKWDIVSTASAKMTDEDVGAFDMAIRYNETIQVTGDSYKYLKMSYTMSMTYEMPTEAEAAQLKQYLELQSGVTVTVSGKKVTASKTTTADADEIADMNEDENKISEDYSAADYPEGTIIKTNKGKTEYKISYKYKSEGEDAEYSVFGDAEVTVTITIKKQK